MAVEKGGTVEPLRLSWSEAASLLGVSQDTVRRRVEVGELGSVKEGKRRWILVDPAVANRRHRGEQFADGSAVAGDGMASPHLQALLERQDQVIALLQQELVAAQERERRLLAMLERSLQAA